MVYIKIALIIVINSKKDIFNEINKKCKEIFYKRIELMNQKNQLIGKQNEIFELCENDGKYPDETNINLNNIINALWEKPKLLPQLYQIQILMI